MNRENLLDSLDGFKGLIFRLLPASIVKSIACVPMTTDGPWANAEKEVFERAIGIPRNRTYWAPGGLQNVPSKSEHHGRAQWIAAVAAINHPYLFLDPDVGLFKHWTGTSERMVLVSELAIMLREREALIVYRHQYWPKTITPPLAVHGYVWDGLSMLRNHGLAAFAYQSQAASLFIVAQQKPGIAPLENGFRLALHGVSPDVIARRLIV